MQATAQYIVSGEVLHVNNSYSDVIVELENNGNKKLLNVSPTGHFRTSLEWNQTYHFKFRKTGYVSKVIEFSTILPSTKQPSTIEPYHMPVRLFKMFEGVDTVFFKNPIARIRFDNNLGDFEHDMDYSLKVKYHIDKMRDEGQKSSKSVGNKPAKKSMPSKDANEKVVKKKVEQAEEAGSDKKKPDKGVYDYKEINGAPDLKQEYKEGETIEEFELKNRIIKRHIFVIDERRRVFLSVKHNWGGHYFFIDEADIGYRCISKETYNDFLMIYRHKLKNNK